MNLLQPVTAAGGPGPKRVSTARTPQSTSLPHSARCPPVRRTPSYQEEEDTDRDKEDNEEALLLSDWFNPE